MLLLLLILLLFVGNCLSIIVNGQESQSTKFCISQTVILGCNISMVENFVWSFSGVLDESSGIVGTSVNSGMKMSPFHLTAEVGRSTLQFVVNSELTGVHNVTCRQNSIVKQSLQSLIVEVLG